MDSHRALQHTAGRICQIRSIVGSRPIHEYIQLRTHKKLEPAENRNAYTAPALFDNTPKRDRNSPRVYLTRTHAISRRHVGIYPYGRSRLDNLFRSGNEIFSGRMGNNTGRRVHSPCADNDSADSDDMPPVCTARSIQDNVYYNRSHNRNIRGNIYLQAIKLGTHALYCNSSKQHIRNNTLGKIKQSPHTAFNIRSRNIHNIPLFSKLYIYRNARTTPADANTRSIRHGGRPARGRLQCKPVKDSNRFRRVLRKRIPCRHTNQTEIRTRARYRLYLLYNRRGDGLRRLGTANNHIRSVDIPHNNDSRKTARNIRASIRVLRSVDINVPFNHKYRYGNRAVPGYRNTVAVLLLRRLLAVGIYYTVVHPVANRCRTHGAIPVVTFPRKIKSRPGMRSVPKKRQLPDL